MCLPRVPCLLEGPAHTLLHHSWHLCYNVSATRLPLPTPAGTQARATPLSPEQWQAMLPQHQPAATAAAQPLSAGAAAHRSGVRSKRQAQQSGAAHRDQQQPPQGLASNMQADLAGRGQGGAQVVVLDVRNQYEWDAGHFRGAERPLEVGLLPCAAPC